MASLLPSVETGSNAVIYKIGQELPATAMAMVPAIACAGSPSFRRRLSISGGVRLRLASAFR
jgi:hypothetical protein